MVNNPVTNFVSLFFRVCFKETQLIYLKMVNGGSTDLSLYLQTVVLVQFTSGPLSLYRQVPVLVNK